LGKGIIYASKYSNILIKKKKRAKNAVLGEKDIYELVTREDVAFH